jgi:hypothetical protein
MVAAERGGIGLVTTMSITRTGDTREKLTVDDGGGRRKVT